MTPEPSIAALLRDGVALTPLQAVAAKLWTRRRRVLILTSGDDPYWDVHLPISAESPTNPT